MSESMQDPKVEEKPTLNVCCDTALAKVDEALLQLGLLERKLKISSPQPHQANLYESIRDVLTAINSVDESAGLLENMSEKESPDVPCKLLEWLDAGKDPDAFYRQLIDDTIWGAQVMQGKMSAMSEGCHRLKSELHEKPNKD